MRAKAGFKYEVAIVERRIEGEAENEYRMVIRHKAMKEEDGWLYFIDGYNDV